MFFKINNDNFEISGNGKRGILKQLKIFPQILKSTELGNYLKSEAKILIK